MPPTSKKVKRRQQKTSRNARAEQSKTGHKSWTEQQGRDKEKNRVTRKSNRAKKNRIVIFLRMKSHNYYTVIDY